MDVSCQISCRDDKMRVILRMSVDLFSSPNSFISYATMKVVIYYSVEEAEGSIFHNKQRINHLRNLQEPLSSTLYLVFLLEPYSHVIDLIKTFT